jgi:2-keto-3-deoxy-6-phosphogluconate aldolase
MDAQSSWQQKKQQSGPKRIVPVSVTTDASEAGKIKNALIAEGILCELDRQTQEGFTAIVNVRVLVRAEDFDRARATIESGIEHLENG